MPSYKLTEILILSIGAPLTLFLILTLSLKILILKKIFSTNTITTLSAGLLLPITFFEFIPHSLDQFSPLNFSLTTLITLAILFLIEIYVIPKIHFSWLPSLQNQPLDCSHYHQHHHHLAHKGGSFSAIGCLLICSFFDGVRLASALLIDIKTTITIGFGLIAHILPEGILVMGLALSSSLSFRHCMILQGTFCALLGLGILLTGFLSISSLHINILALASASLLYVCFIHLLPVALQKQNQKWFFTSLVLITLLYQIV